MRIVLLMFLLILASCGNEDQVQDGNKEVITPKTGVITKSSTGVYSYKITENDTAGFGYEILQGEKTYIRQPVIPAIQGNHAFRSRDDAEKAAKLVLSKLDQGINPPTVSRQELEGIGIMPE